MLDLENFTDDGLRKFDSDVGLGKFSVQLFKRHRKRPINTF